MAVWVDQVGLHSIFEIEAVKILATVGPVIHSPLNNSRSKFQDARGCVLIDLTADLVDGIAITDGTGKQGFVCVAYLNLPNYCHLCRQKGHLPRTCPTKESFPHTGPSSLGGPLPAPSPQFS
jgi:hypothetical protein